jgi:hypothetical protein
MLKNIFEKKRKDASPTRKETPPLTADALLQKAQQSLTRLRMLQPSDPEAFPLVNEASRYGDSTLAARSVCFVTAQALLFDLKMLHLAYCCVLSSAHLT